MDNREMDFEGEDDAAVVGESKADRFKRVVNPRLKVAVKRLRMIRGMFEGANANNYEFSNEQRAKLIAGLRSEVDEIDRLMGRRMLNDEEPTLFI